MTNPPEPILVAHLLPRLESELVTLLRSLSPEDWLKPTACPLWTVKDIAAHLLDTSLRRVSAGRDGHLPPIGDPPKTPRGWVDLLNRLNAEWVEAARRVSPPLLVDLVELAGCRLCQHLQSVDPFSEALFPVSWAGEERSLAWFDVAREYTERWHHQQQIRDAVGRQGICTREFLHPVLDTFLRGLPHALRDLERPAGTLLTVRIKGEAGGEWRLISEGKTWRPAPHSEKPPDAAAILDQDTAWRLFTHGLPPEEALRRSRLEGDRELAAGFAKLLAVMA